MSYKTFVTYGYSNQFGQKIKQYLFFSYASNEALHLSAEERTILQDYMDKIKRELQHPIDKFSKSLIISNIEVAEVSNKFSAFIVYFLKSYKLS